MPRGAAKKMQAASEPESSPTEAAAGAADESEVFGGFGGAEETGFGSEGGSDSEPETPAVEVKTIANASEKIATLARGIKLPQGFGALALDGRSVALLFSMFARIRNAQLPHLVFT